MHDSDLIAYFDLATLLSLRNGETLYRFRNPTSPILLLAVVPIFFQYSNFMDHRTFALSAYFFEDRLATNFAPGGKFF